MCNGRAAIGPVSLACCDDGNCAAGVPPTCSANCAAVFIPFMDTYNHGSCMTLMQTVGGTLGLGDLEARCRETLGTDGGADASRTDCSTAASMSVVLACSRETANDAAFCRSPCYATLNPYLEECSAEIPSQIQRMLEPVTAMVEPCRETGPAQQECDMTRTMTACQFDPPGEELDCGNTCLQNLFLCQTDPMLPAIFGARMVAYLPGLQATCAPQTDANSGVGGDGLCDLSSLHTCVAGGRALDAECGTGPQDPQCTCATDCVREYMDCVDNPTMADSRDQIVFTQQLCASAISIPPVPENAGDGACNLFA